METIERTFEIKANEFSALYYIMLTSKSLIDHKNNDYLKESFIKELEQAINDYKKLKNENKQD